MSAPSLDTPQDLDWSAAQTGGLATAGSFDVLHGFNAFTGTGSYFGGVDAGYNYVFPPI